MHGLRLSVSPQAKYAKHLLYGAEVILGSHGPLVENKSVGHKPFPVSIGEFLVAFRPGMATVPRPIRLWHTPDVVSASNVFLNTFELRGMNAGKHPSSGC